MMKRTVFMDWIWSQRNFKHVYAIHVPKHGRLRIIIGCKLNLFTHTHRWLWCINDVRMLFKLLPIGMWLTFRQDEVFTRKCCWWLKCIYQKVSVTRFNLILCVVSCEHEKCMSYHLKWVHWRRMFKDHVERRIRKFRRESCQVREGKLKISTTVFRNASGPSAQQSPICFCWRSFQYVVKSIISHLTWLLHIVLNVTKTKRTLKRAQMEPMSVLRATSVLSKFYPKLFRFVFSRPQTWPSSSKKTNVKRKKKPRVEFRQTWGHWQARHGFHYL